MDKLAWKTAPTIFTINQDDYLRSHGIADEDIKEYGNEIMDQLMGLFNYCSWSEPMLIKEELRKLKRNHKSGKEVIDARVAR